MPFYENVFLVRPDVSPQQVEVLAQSFSTTLSEKGGNITKVEHWGLRNLAYRVKKNRKAHYVLFNIDAPATAMRDLEQTMRMSEDVLRSLTIRVDALEEGPSIVMQSKSRDDRPRRNQPHESVVSSGEELGESNEEKNDPKFLSSEDGNNKPSEPNETPTKDTE